MVDFPDADGPSSAIWFGTCFAGKLIGVGSCLADRTFQFNTRQREGIRTLHQTMIRL